MGDTLGLGSGSAPLSGRAAHTPVPPNAIPGYSIVREIQRGGQGVVYLAVQESTRRQVAIKVLRLGPMSAQADIARFDREVDLLGRLRHPNVVSILDRGECNGYSFYVMDYVAGRALGDHLHETDAPLRTRVELFEKVADAVNAAHLHGIIHRDLKPSNIRVDEQGEPRVLDFGLAREMIGAPEQDVTMTGQFVGSLLWASPEQVQGDASRIDLRTDVYSLGVMLYHALTGEFPYPVMGTTGQTIAHIIGTEPAKPSGLNTQIDDELETIVLKCLAKEPERRYQTAGELSRDLGRYRRAEPIEAKRDSSWYVVRTVLRRHRAATALAAALLVMVVASGATMSVLYRQAEYARRTAVSRQQDAETQARRSAQTQEFLRTMLQSVNPFVAAGGDTTVIERMLEEARVQNWTVMASQPEVQASIHDTLGVCYASMCRFKDARDELEEALRLRREHFGDRSPLVAETLRNLSNLCGDEEKIDEAERHIAEALDILDPLPRGHQELYYSCMESRARALTKRREFVRAEEIYRSLLDTRLRSDTLPRWRVAEAYTRLGNSLRDQSKYDEAEQAFRQALEIHTECFGDDHPYVAKTLSALGSLQWEKHELGAAEANMRKALDIFQRVMRGPHLDVVSIQNNLAAVLNFAGRHSEALPIAEEAFAMRRTLLGKDMPSAAPNVLNIGASLKNLGRYKEAEEKYRYAIELATAGGNDRVVATALNNLGALRKVQDDPQGAEEFDREALALRRKIFGDNHLDVAQSLNNLAVSLGNQKKYKEAEELMRECLKIQISLVGARNRVVGMTMRNLSDNLLHQDPASDEALLLLEEALRILSESSPAGERWRIKAGVKLAGALLSRGRAAEAETHLLDCVKQFDHLSTADRREVSRMLAEVYDTLGETEKARTWREQGSPAGTRGRQRKPAESSPAPEQ